MFTMLILMNFLIMIFMILLLMNFLLSKKKNLNREKMTPFECGFDPLISNRLPFSIQFYMISLIFLIFDIEIIIFFPLVPAYMYSLTEINLLMIMFFIYLLMLGLYMEWNDGALKWLK